ncbi:DUF4135 domain-containing protein [Endozoicomonas sp. 4G]|uniref:DUF4135 domain-containing protein n=1 Tax=Endozoicomonas sp. 4G TaxID=2872754 RepID=UPI002078DE6F|nr:DUF4135 domain-containing protein [Endozoicomonas sp. 4G]
MMDPISNHTVFGCLVTWAENSISGYNGLRQANEAFLKAVIRYSRFDELHLFLHEAQTAAFRQDWKEYLSQYGAGKNIHILPVHDLPSCLQKYVYTVFHSGDPYIADLASLRERYAAGLFPITGRAHSLSDDARLSRVRDLIFSPIKPCDSILCSSKAQKTVMKRLISSASASVSDTVGAAVPYRGQVSLMPLGIEPARPEAAVGKEGGVLQILCLGRLSAADKMDLHPLLLALNDLFEEGTVTRFQLVIAGAGDAAGEYVRSLLAQAYEFNLEDCIRFELSVDDEKRKQLLAQADVFVALADNVQESFGLAPVEAMRVGVPVILSDWNGYRDLIVSGQEGFLIKTTSADHDDISRPLSLLSKTQAQLIQAQGVAVDIEALKAALSTLLTDESVRKEMSGAAVRRVNETFSWPLVIDQYHRLVEELGEEASRIRHHQGRAVGMPYQDVFGHYASVALQETDVLVATDRGLRVLLMSEKGFFFSQLSHLLDKNEIREVIRKLVTPQTVSSIQKLFPGRQSLLFLLSWMLKYQLVDFSTQTKAGKPAFARLPNWFNADDSCLVNGLVFPEQLRSKWLKPVINQYIKLIQSYVADVDGSENSVLQSIAQSAIEWMDERLLQAIGWLAKDHTLTRYGEVLKLLESKGVEVLIDAYPHWYRNLQKEFFQHVRLTRTLLSRVKQDLSEINHYFFSESRQLVESHQPTSGLIAIRNLQLDSGPPVYQLTFNNGEHLVYKLRDLAIDQLLVGDKQSMAQSLNGWLQDPDALGLFRILNKSSYGYIEFIASETVAQSDDLETYHRRMGVASGFCLMSGLTDIHSRNLHISGNKPYLIDAETALHSPVIMQLQTELQNPELSFLRGMQDSSLGLTGLMKVWENFHTYQIRYSSVKLENGELVAEQPQSITAFLDHLLMEKGRHSLDGAHPSVASQYGKAFVEGFRSSVSAISQHSEQWCDYLESMAGFEVRYQPCWNLNDARKQFRDLHVARELQDLSRARRKGYLLRLAKRITLAGEVSQRWLDAPWQEPVSVLAESVAEGWQAKEQRDFVRKLGESGVFVKRYDGTLQEVSGDYFSVNTIEKQSALIVSLSDHKLRERFLNACQQMIESWFQQHINAGGEMPEELRQTVLEALADRAKKA